MPYSNKAGGSCAAATCASIVHPSRQIPGEEPSDWRIRGRRRNRTVIANYARVVRKKAPPARGVADDRIGVDRVSNRWRQAVVRVGDGIAGFGTARQDVVKQTGLC
jgi:hypothetical protein